MGFFGNRATRQKWYRQLLSVLSSPKTTMSFAQVPMWSSALFELSFQ